MSRSVVVYPTHQSVADAAAARFLLHVSDLLTKQDRVDVAVTGGTLGIDVIAAISQSTLVDIVDWSTVHVWWSDERYVPASHADRNDGQADAAGLTAIALPAENVHRVLGPDASSSLEESAAVYASALPNRIDVAILGLGPDGHVASLFPDHSGLADNSARAIAVTDSPKPPAQRVSFSLDYLRNSAEIWVVASGAAKADAVRSCLTESVLPGSFARGTGRTLWLIDYAASI